MIPGFLTALCGTALVLSTPSQAQDGTNLRVSCGGVFDLCGYDDAVSGQEVIPRRFGKAHEFSEGLAAVRVEGIYGVIDPTGEMVIAPEYDEVGPFEFGLARILVNNRVGLVDRSGKIVVEPDFGKLKPISPNAAIAHRDNWRMDIPGLGYAFTVHGSQAVAVWVRQGH